MPGKLEMNYTKVFGYNCRTIITFDAQSGESSGDEVTRSREMIKNGILWEVFIICVILILMRY